MEERSRMLMKFENAIIIDHNTIYMDSINQAMEIAEVDSEAGSFITDQLYLLDELFVFLDLVQVPTRDMIDKLYGKEVGKYLKVYKDKNNKRYINPYKIRNEYPLTDFGAYLLDRAKIVGSKITWTIIKSKDNPFILPGYEQNTIEMDLNDYRKIYEYIVNHEITIIFMDDPNLFEYLLRHTDIKNITFMYTDCADNYIVTDDGTRLFKYAGIFEGDEEIERGFEIVNVKPFDNMFKEYLNEIGIDPEDEDLELELVDLEEEDE